MATLNLDPGIKMPDYSDYNLISPVQQDAANREAFVQSRSDYAQSISMPGPDITDIINEVNQLGARTDELLAKGNPDIPSFGAGMGYQSDFNSSMSRGYGNFLSSINSGPSLQSRALAKDLGPAEDLERYTSSEDFSKFGYVPSIGSEQEYRYGRDMSWGETVGKALSGGASIAADTFMEGWKGWGRMAEALFTWDSSKLMGSREERYEIAKKQEAIFNKYAIFNTPESEESLLNRQFFGNMLQQTGFTVGALAQVGLEFWLSGLLGRAISSAVGIGKARALTTAVDVGELINDTRKASNVISNTERVTSAFKNLSKSLIPLYGTAEDLFKASKAGAGAMQLGLIGLGGIKRELSIFNMARSEAIFEAASTYKDLEDKLTKEFVSNNQRQPNAQELENIRNSADRASSDNFYTNTAILSVMNRMQFGNMFKGFNGTRKLFGEGLSPFAKDVFEVTGKAAGKTVTKVYEKGFIGRLGALPNIAKTFGTKKAAWEASKSIGLGLMKFEGSEGVQELLQDASNKGLSDYYYDLYHGKKGYGDKMDRILDSVKNPLTDLEGAKTFLMGALTGRLIAPFSYAGSKLTEGKKGKEIAQRRKEAIDIINTFYNDPTQYTKEWIANVKVQNRAAQNMEEAAANGDRYTFYNTKDSAFAKAVASAIKLNMYDSLKDTLTEMGRGLTDEEFKEAFKMEASKDNRENVTQFIEKVVNQIDDYYTLYNNLKDKYGDRIAPELYRNNKPEEYERVKIAKMAQDNAIEMLTTNVFKARQATRRAAQLQAEIAANPNIGSSSTEVLTKLGSEQAINDQVRTLEQEIAFYENAETLSPDQKLMFKLKKQELKLVQAWQQSFEDVMTGEGESYYSEGAVKKIYKNFENLVNFYNKTEEKGVSVSTQDIEDVFTKFLDYIQLNKDSKAYIDAMNLLADPYNMSMIIESMKSSIPKAGKKMQKEHLAEVESIKTDEEIAAEAPKPENKPPDQPPPAGTSSESATTKSGTPENTGQQTAEGLVEQLNNKAELAIQESNSELEVDTVQEVQTRLNEDLGVTSTISIDAHLNGLHYVQTEDGKYYVIPDSNASGYESVSAIEVTKEQIIKPFRTEAEWKKVGIGVAVLEGAPAPTEAKKADIEAAYSYITTRKYEGDRRDQVNKVGEDLAKRFVATLKEKGLVKEGFRTAERTDGSVEKVKVNTDTEGNNLGNDWSTAGKFKEEFRKFVDAELAALGNTKPIDSTPQTYADQFDLSTLNTEPVTSDIVDEIMSSTQSAKSDNFDNSTEDFFSTLTSCNL